MLHANEVPVRTPLARVRQETKIAASREGHASRNCATGAAAQEVRFTVPLLPDGVVTEQGSGDLTWIGSSSIGVECSQRHDPTGHAAFWRNERARKPPQAPESSQSLQRHQLRLDAGKAGELVAQRNRAGEETLASDLELDPVKTIAEENMLDPVALPQQDHRMFEAPNIERVNTVAADGAGFDGKNGRIDIGPPEDGSRTRAAMCSFAESATPRRGQRRPCCRGRSRGSPVSSARIPKLPHVSLLRYLRRPGYDEETPMPNLRASSSAYSRNLIGRANWAAGRFRLPPWS